MNNKIKDIEETINWLEDRKWTLVNRTENQGFWLSLGLDTKQYRGADTNRGGPALMPALPHEALGSLQCISLSAECGDNST